MQLNFKQEYASKEELLFSYYVKELLDNGWLEEAVYQPKPFVLSEDKFVHVFESHKGDNNVVDIKLTRGSVYTADWRLIWSKKADNVFYWTTGGVYKKGFYPFRKNKKDVHIPFYAYAVDGKITSYVDIKGVFVGRNNSSGVTFSNNQKWLMSKGVFVQKVVVSLCEKSIFYRTFTPRTVVSGEVYKKDYKDKKAGESKLKYKPVLIEHFVKHHL